MTTIQADRMAGLDIFRGIAVAGMIVVNNPGSGAHIWWPLDHAAWHGLTPTDLIFPAFLFAVGVALGLSFPRRLDPADRAAMWRRIARRGAALIALGMVFTILARLSLDNLRYLGVLQRIGITYMLAAALALISAVPSRDGWHRLNLPAIAWTAVVLLGLYWALLSVVPVPGSLRRRATWPALSIALSSDPIICGVSGPMRQAASSMIPKGCFRRWARWSTC